MKTSRLIFLAFLSISLVFLPACNDDPEEELSPYIGEYSITKASLAETLSLEVNELETPIDIPAGSIITTMIQTALLGAIDCVPESSLIELREDFSLFISCATSLEEIDGGTWQEISLTEILLNLNATAVPSAPGGIPLSVTNVTLVGNLLTGTTTVPISAQMLAGVVAGMGLGLTLDLENTPPVVLVTLTIELTKQ